MSLSPFEHPFLSGLFGDAELSDLFSAEADIAAMLRFEIALAKAQVTAGVIPADEAQSITNGLADFSADIDKLRDGVAKDGVVIPEFVRQLRSAVGGDAAAKVHFGATSQDVIDSSLILRLKDATDILMRRLSDIVSSMEDIDVRDGGNVLMGYTRMQPAIAITVADRVASWAEPLRRDLARLEQVIQGGFAVQLGGAAGTLEKLGENAPAVRRELSRILGLQDRPQWHSQRDVIVEFGTILALITGSVGKFGQDVALLAQMGGEIRLSGGGGSSAMPHKQNPVAAEALVTLARFNATQISALHHAMLHEQERSGGAWMLEWLTLPQMVLATGSSLISAQRLLSQIDRLGTLAD
jgi:3-carboxy-cis,cis-muconate cycloisomerase